MAGYRKLGRNSNQRKALLRSQVTALLYHGKIRTTEARAKEIRKIAEAFKSAISRAKIDSDGNLVIPSDRARRAS